MRRTSASVSLLAAVRFGPAAIVPEGATPYLETARTAADGCVAGRSDIHGIPPAASATAGWL